MSGNKFKVGDLVKVKTTNLYRFTGTIVDHNTTRGDDNYWAVRLDTIHYDTPNEYHGYSTGNIEHARIKDTKIARKMNKNNIRKIEDGWIYKK